MSLVSSSLPVTPARPRWGVREAVWAYVLGIVCAQIGTLPPLAAGAATESVPTLVGGLVGLWVGLAGVPVWLSRRRGSGSPRRDFGLWAAPRDLWLGAVAAGATIGLVLYLLYPPVVHVLERAEGHHIDIGKGAAHLASLGRGPGFVVFGVSVIVGAPLAEELFFRGLLQPALQRWCGAAGGIALSALAFGLAHAEGNPVEAIPPLIVFGAVLGVLAWRTGRLGAAVVAHVAFNGFTVAVLAARR